MTLSEMTETLNREGFRVTPAQISYARISGRLGPVGFDGAGNAIFDCGHLARMKMYLSRPRPRGRRPREAVGALI